MLSSTGNTYTLSHHLGTGSFGQVFNIVGDPEIVAKIVKYKEIQTVIREIKIMIKLKSKKGFPKIIDFGKASDNEIFLVLDRLDYTFEQMMI